MLQGQKAEYSLNRAGRAGGVPGIRLGGTYRRQVVAKNPPQRRALGRVVIGRSGAMRIDLVDVCRLKTSPLKCLCHCQIGAFSIFRRCSLVEGITGIPESGKDGQRFGTALQSTFQGFQYQIGGTLSQVQAGTAGIERTARLLVQDHQGVEAVQVIVGQALAATRHYALALARTQQISAIDDGIGGRRTGGR